MKTQVSSLLKAQRKIEKVYNKRKYMSKEDQEILDKELESDKDIQVLIRYKNKQIQED